ncbi:MAG: HAD family phosphatase [Porphyromonas sp.]|nr:HAD family phosphatase [Porphyromonas sp.]
MIRNILFDLGGVFIELTREESIRRFELLGVHDAGALLDPYKQEGIFLALESGKYSKEGFTERVNKEYGLALKPEQIRHALEGFVVKMQDWKFDFIEQELPEEIHLLLVSNTNAFVWEEAEAGHLLKNGRPISSYFEHVTTSYEAGICKPERSIFEKIIEETKIRPEETLFIDDGPANTAVARSMGFVTYCPDNGEDWRPLLRKMLGTRK